MRKFAIILLGVPVGFVFLLWLVGVVLSVFRDIASWATGLHIVLGVLGVIVGAVALVLLLIVGQAILSAVMAVYGAARLVVEACTWVVRYVSSSGSVRVSVRQAVRVRWGWSRLARMLSLQVQDGTRLRSKWTVKDGRMVRKEKEVPHYQDQAAAERLSGLLVGDGTRMAQKDGKEAAS